MKLIQITEAISLIKYHQRIKDKIFIYFRERLNITFDKKYEDEDIRYVEDALGDILGNVEKIKNQLSWVLEKECNEIAEQELDTFEYIISVQFGNIKNSGECSGTIITLNNDFLNSILKNIEKEYIYGRRGIGNSYNTVEEYNQAMPHPLNQLSIDSNALVGVLIHELVHAIQHSIQFNKGRDDLEYRSYIEKNKKAFHDNVRNLSNRDEKRSYYASPQEIAAHSHNIALQIIEDLDINNKSDFEKYKSNISQYVKSHLYGVFDRDDMDNPKLKKIFNRYYKLIYLELERYLSQLEVKSEA